MQASRVTVTGRLNDWFRVPFQVLERLLRGAIVDFSPGMTHHWETVKPRSSPITRWERLLVVNVIFFACCCELQEISCHKNSNMVEASCRKNGDDDRAFADNESVLSGHSNDQEAEMKSAVDDSRSGNKLLEGSIAVKESKAVRWIRAIATAVVLFSTLGVCLSVFFYMTNSEKDTFESRFHSDSYKVLESIGSTFDRSMGSVDSFAVNMVSSAMESNQTWPFVTIANFPVKSSKILSLSKGMLFSMYHYVKDEERPLWNTYAISNDNWVLDSVEVQEKALNKTFFGPINRKWVKSDDIWNYDGAAPKNEFYYAAWQQYPMIPGDGLFYSWDYWLYLDSSGKKMHETHRPAITSAYNLPDPTIPEEVAFTESSVDWYRDYLPPGRNPYEPFSDLLYVRSNTPGRVFGIKNQCI
jgi:hypothetical protein